MRRVTSPRTELLLRAYLGLLAVSIVMSGVLIERRLAAPQAVAGEIVLAPSAIPRGVAPMINWGGQKR
jgi:hypothetical protein